MGGGVTGMAWAGTFSGWAVVGGPVRGQGTLRMYGRPSFPDRWSVDPSPLV